MTKHDFAPGARVETDVFLSVYVPGYGPKTFNRGTIGHIDRWDSFYQVYRVALQDRHWPAGFTIMVRPEAIIPAPITADA